MTRKSCPYCYSSNVNKHGVRNGKQRYQCTSCRTCWTNLSRPERLRANIWHDYVFERQTIRQLGHKYGKGHRCIRAALEAYLPPIEIDCPRPVTVILDTTYFGNWGLLVAIDPYADRTKGQNLALYWAELEATEHTFDYDVATDTLQAMSYQIQAAVIDGRRGVREMLLAKGIPVQHCQFHQLQTITQCLTKRPTLIPNQELRAIALTLSKTTKVQFTTELDAWYAMHGAWLKERYIEPQTGRTRYQHDRTRRAYFSLRRNLDYLFTYQDKQLTEQGIQIPNTTNALDGRFGVWKTKLKAHRGCSKSLKTKMLVSLLSEATDGRKYQN